jgi:flagellar basal-body rod protein FlgB
MDASNAILLIKALDGLSARAVVTAQNIANASTPGYRPLRLTFEKALQNAATQGDDAVAQLQPRVERAPASEGGLRLDLEMATASTTTLRYSALIEVLNREMQINSIAITGNN